MRVRIFQGLAIFVGTVAAQNFFSSLVSDATSIYGDVTSMLAGTSTSSSSSFTATFSDSSNPSQTTSSSSVLSNAISTDSSSSSSSTSSQSITSASVSSSTASPTSTVSLASATASSSSTSTPTSASASGSSHGGGISGKTLGIIIGCVLGVLLLILLVLLLVCCRRRRRRRYYGSSRTRSNSSGEKGWGGVARPRSRSPSLKGVYTTPSKGDHLIAAPLASNPVDGHSHTGEAGNPFVPPLPPPRRKPIAGQGSVNGLHHSAPPYVPGDYPDRYYQNPRSPHGGYEKPFAADGSNIHQPASDSIISHSGTNHPDHTANHHGYGKALAAGAGGLALGGIAAKAAHHHDDHHDLRGSPKEALPLEKRQKRFSEMDDMTLPQVVTDYRPQSTPYEEENKRHSAGFPNSPAPFLTSDEDGSTAVNSTVADPVEVKSKDSSRARRRSWSLGRDRSVSTEGTSRRRLTPTLPLLVGTGAGVAAAATASRKNRNGSKSPHRKGILKQTVSPSSSSNENGDAHDRITPVPAFDNGPHELTGINIPPTPPLRDRSVTPLGTAAPAAAAASYFDERSTPPAQRRRYSITGSNTPTHPPVPPVPAGFSTQDTRRHTLPPSIGQRSLHISGQSYEEHQTDSQDVYSQHQAVTPHRGYVSPDLGPYRGIDHDDLMSPVSPVTASHSGTLTQAEAANLAATGFGSNYESMSEDNMPRSLPSSGDVPGSRNSRVISAVQEPFLPTLETGGPKSIVGDNGYPHHNIPRRMSGGEYDSSETGPLGPQVLPLPRKRHTPWAQDAERERSSSSDSTYRTSLGTAQGRESAVSRKSGESGRYPPRSYNNTSRSVRSRSSSRNSRHSNNASIPGTPRRSSRPGYGYGSGDPYDMATRRMDSNMTGHSVAPPDNYEVQQLRRSRANSASSKRWHGAGERPEDRYERLNGQPDDDFAIYSGSDVGLAY